MIEYEVVKLMWKSSKKDLVPMFVTFLFCLIIGVEYGILSGVGINLMFLLYPSARPTIHVDKYTVRSNKKIKNEGIPSLFLLRYFKLLIVKRALNPCTCIGFILFRNI